MKKHPTLPDTLISNDETFVIDKDTLTEAMVLLKEFFEDDYKAATDINDRRAIVGASLTFAMRIPYEAGRELFVNDQELHSIIDKMMTGFDLWLTIQEVMGHAGEES